MLIMGGVARIGQDHWRFFSLPVAHEGLSRINRSPRHGSLGFSEPIANHRGGTPLLAMKIIMFKFFRSLNFG